MTLSLNDRAAQVADRLAADAEAGASHVTAGNYGGKLGPHHIHLRELVP